MFRVELALSAERDLRAGFRFYEARVQGLGSYFLSALTSDIDALRISAGVHPRPLLGFHRALSKRFPFAIYYDFDGVVVRVAAVLDCRRDPASITKRLG
jgi:plasmid stabilization system protein ParE